MAAALYRSAEARDAVRAWCTDRLDGWARDHERSTLATGLGETHVVDVGTGDPTVVLIPGTNLNTATGLDLADQLADQRRVVALDLPGQPGLSAPTRPKGRIAAYGAWLDEVLATVDGPLVLVGHSLGAAVVPAATPTDRIAGIVLVDPAGFTKPALGIGLLKDFVVWMVRPSDRSSAALIEEMQAGGHPAPSQLTEWFTLVARSCRSGGAPGPTETGLVRRWRGTRCAVVVGEQDAVFPPDRLNPVVKELLDVSPTVVPGAGHLLPHEDPAAVAAAVFAIG